MTTDTSVKYFDSSMSGAPALSNTAGTLISVLDACLVNGFGSMTLTSLVIAGNVATATKTGHGFVMRGSTGPVIAISGATPAELNTEFRIQSIPDANTFTFTTSGISDQTATGTISAKRAPAGFSKAFSGTNKAAYQSNDPAGTQLFLRVDDTYTTYSRVRGYENIADQTAFDNNAATGPFPTDAQISGGEYLYKATASNRSWTLFSDGRILYFFCDTTGGAAWYGGIIFGDLDSYVVADAFGCVLIGATGTSDWMEFYRTQVTANAHYLARASNQVGSSTALGKYSHGRASWLGFGGPTYQEDALLLWPIEGWDATTVPRGLFPGCWNPVSASVPHGVILSGIPQLSGRDLMTQKMYTNSTCAIDITGPWR